MLTLDPGHITGLVSAATSVGDHITGLLTAGTQVAGHIARAAHGTSASVGSTLGAVAGQLTSSTHGAGAAVGSALGTAAGQAAGQAAGATAAATTTAAPGLASTNGPVNLSVDPTSLPGSPQLQSLADGIAGWALTFSLVGLVIGSAAWALGSHSQNFQQTYVGRKAVLISGVAALLIGAAQPIINFFFNTGQSIKSS